MTEQEHYAKQSCWRCRRCGSRTPLEKSVCSNPVCRAELSIFGEVCTPASDPAEPDVGHPGRDAGKSGSRGAGIWEEPAAETKAERKARAKAEAAENPPPKSGPKGEPKQARREARAAGKRPPAEKRGKRRPRPERSQEGLRQMPVWKFALLAVLVILTTWVFFAAFSNIALGPSRWTVIYAAAAAAAIAAVALLILTIRRWNREPRFRSAFRRICAIILSLGLLCFPALWMYFLGVQSSALVAPAVAIALFLLTKRDPAVPAFLFLGVMIRYLAIYGAVPAYFAYFGW